MKNIFIIFLMTLSLVSCNEEKYIKEKCLSMVSLSKTLTLKVKDTIPGFSGRTHIGTRFSLNSFNKDYLLLLFKKQKYPMGGLLNEEIIYNELGKLANTYNVDILIGLDIKIAKIYGAEILKNEIKNNLLFVVDRNKTIQKIYRDVCEEDVILILNELRFNFLPIK